MENRESRDILLSIFGVALLILAVAGISYAIFTFSKAGVKDNIIKSGSISMQFIESNNVINITNALPTSDNIGRISNDYFDFSVNGTIVGNRTIFYEVRAKQLSVENQIESHKIKLYLEKKSSSQFISVLEPTNFNITNTTNINNEAIDLNSMLLYSGNFTTQNKKRDKFSDNFRLRMWIDENSSIENIKKNFKIRINVYANL